ncbi:unnamed protein product, partial [Mesorhabditis spiculigera]
MVFMPPIVPKMYFPSDCPPHYSGDSCDWPICINGRIDSATRRCICRSHFAMPFCEECEAPWWGADCDKAPLDAIPDAQFGPWSDAIPYLPQAVLLISIILLVSALFCGLRLFLQTGGCQRRRTRSLSVESEAFDFKPHVHRAPPPYKETMCDEPPPPYTL